KLSPSPSSRVTVS
nr:Chain D, laminB1 residues 179-191 [Homo sapiens]5VVX_B Chain B, Lamin B1 [Homo sapiens]5VVX_D Chain D, Lamin B1 [Homo sapiens]